MLQESGQEFCALAWSTRLIHKLASYLREILFELLLLGFLGTYHFYRQKGWTCPIHDFQLSLQRFLVFPKVFRDFERFLHHLK